jgi:hypothetical protein
MFLNSTINGPIRIEKIAWEEPHPSRIGSSNFGAKRVWALFNLISEEFIKSEISQRDISPLVWGLFANLRENSKYTRKG